MTSEPVDHATRRAAIIDLLAEHCGVPVERMNGSTRLYHDLGIYGDDVDDLFEVLADRFGIDFAGLVFTEFFRDEVWSLLDLFRKRTYRPLTIDHLVAVIERGRWFDPPA